MARLSIYPIREVSMFGEIQLLASWLEQNAPREVIEFARFEQATPAEIAIAELARAYQTNRVSRAGRRTRRR